MRPSAGSVPAAVPVARHGVGQFARDGSLRPPWSREALVRDNCTSCGACMVACPEAILQPGPAGTPVVDFGPGFCTFCRACAEACPEPVFDLAAPPWEIVARLGRSCLLNAAISCRSCTDACDENALRFDLRSGPVGRVSVDPAACTGCGACLEVCPVGAIAMTETHTEQEEPA